MRDSVDAIVWVCRCVCVYVWMSLCVLLHVCVFKCAPTPQQLCVMAVQPQIVVCFNFDKSETGLM